MQRKMLVERERTLLGPGARHRDRRPRLVIGVLAIRHDDIEPVDRAPQHHNNEALRRCGTCRPTRRCECDRRAGSGKAEEIASPQFAHLGTYRRMKSGPPSSSAARCASGASAMMV